MQRMHETLKERKQADILEFEFVSEI